MPLAASHEMYRKGHLGIAGVVAGILPWALPVSLWITLTAVIIIFERVPDKDHVIPLIAHRGYSHTLVGAAVVGGCVTAAVLGSIIYLTAIDPSTIIYATTGTGELLRALGIIIWVGAVLGFATHMIGDMITVGTDLYDIKPLAPFSNWGCGIQLCKASSEKWNRVFFVSGAAILSISIVTKASLSIL